MNTENTKKIGELIKDLRNYLELSLDVFGKPIGYSSMHISRYETGKYQPTEETIATICSVYHVNPGYFTGEVQLEDAVVKVTQKDKNIEVGNRLKAVRLEHGLTQQELAVMTGMHHGKICRLELGESELKPSAAEKLAEALEVGVDWLLTGDERNKQHPADKKMMDWLKNHPEAREKVWKWMK